MLNFLITHYIKPFAFIVRVLVAVVILSLLEGKVLGSMQVRNGPNVVGPDRLLQPIIGGVMLIIKDPVRPSTSSAFVLLAAPMLGLSVALILGAPIAIPPPMFDLHLRILLILALSSLTVYSILGSGWASNSTYALIGALRAVARTISYDVSLWLISLSVLIISWGLTLQTFTIALERISLLTPASPVVALRYFSALGETYRARLDVTQRESQLVCGFYVVYGGAPFPLCFLAVYAIMLVINSVSAVLLLAASLMPYMPALSAIILITTAGLLCAVFQWVRGSYRRIRYDQLMHLVWKIFVPLPLAFLLWHADLPIALARLPPQL
uniref:NADH-ubiquinone oxidoreductase chain 1 n=1 Tax=Acrossocheilus paradoxus TaxID=76593 RepID=A0A125R6W9_ACRPD|nr:NADH dehydrogenase subunit 1 [Acrossocheilus paradoxus]AMD11926.1 NADH dehydrogenase subunit 1 [Acrossocheilus paradoxus]